MDQWTRHVIYKDVIYENNSIKKGKVMQVYTKQEQKGI